MQLNPCSDCCGCLGLVYIDGSPPPYTTKRFNVPAKNPLHVSYIVPGSGPVVVPFPAVDLFPSATCYWLGCGPTNVFYEGFNRVSFQFRMITFTQGLVTFQVTSWYTGADCTGDGTPGETPAVLNSYQARPFAMVWQDAVFPIQYVVTE